MSKRNDAVPAEQIKPYNAVIPYLMRKRSDSLVYHRFSVDITPSVHFIEQKNAEAEEKNTAFSISSWQLQSELPRSARS